MREAMRSAPVGDDVMGEDPTVNKLEQTMANTFDKEAALFLPTGTMSNLCAVLAHCDRRASEVVVGSTSHLCLYEQGGMSTLGGVHSRQVIENDDGTIPLQNLIDAIRPYDDPHYPYTRLVCLENTHNMCGGSPLSKEYIDSVASLDVVDKVHIDGARIFNACVALDTKPASLCENVSSVSICLSKGLGSPVGSVLVGDSEFIALARRARKACGGGMRQAGILAAAGLYAVENNVDRLADDHRRAKFFADSIKANVEGVTIEKVVKTNIVYFNIANLSISVDEFAQELKDDYNVLLGSGYCRGDTFRVVLHKDVDDEMIERAVYAVENVVKKKR
jgi:threonine aldolase